MSIRTGQREYFYQKLDEHFPGLKAKYQKSFGMQYQCPSPEHERLSQVFNDECQRQGVRIGMEFFAPHRKEQPTLF
jgi:DNA polymerase III delta subunit